MTAPLRPPGEHRPRETGPHRSRALLIRRIESEPQGAPRILHGALQRFTLMQIPRGPNQASPPEKPSEQRPDYGRIAPGIQRQTGWPGNTCG